MHRILERAAGRRWSAGGGRARELGPSGFSDKTEHCGVAQAPPGGDGHSSTRKSECRTASACGRLWLVGTDDPYFGHADLDASFKGVPDTAFALVLTHAPEAFEELAQRPAARLVLAGHTHGGQV